MSNAEPPGEQAPAHEESGALPSQERVPLTEEIMGEDVPIPDEEDIDIVMRRVKFIRGLNPATCKRININACLLETMDGIADAINLEVIELSENKLTHISGLSQLKKIRHLDLSFNQLRSADGLESTVPSIEILRLQNNKIPTIPSCIAQMSNLRELEFGANKIKKIENIPFQSLEELWLGRNRLRDDAIDDVPDLQFPKLRILSLQDNALTKFPLRLALTAPNLEELYLSENFIVEPPEDEQFLNLKKLTHLDLSYNKLTRVGKLIPKMTNLKELWLNSNQISDLSEIKALSTLTNLESLYLEANPLKDSLGPGYRQFILDILPNLQQVDAVYLGRVVIKGTSKKP